jgi:hypothetical protein
MLLVVERDGPAAAVAAAVAAVVAAVVDVAAAAVVAENSLQIEGHQIAGIVMTG